TCFEQIDQHGHGQTGVPGDVPQIFATARRTCGFLSRKARVRAGTAGAAISPRWPNVRAIFSRYADFDLARASIRAEMAGTRFFATQPQHGESLRVARHSAQRHSHARAQVASNCSRQSDAAFHPRPAEPPARDGTASARGASWRGVWWSTGWSWRPSTTTPSTSRAARLSTRTRARPVFASRARAQAAIFESTSSGACGTGFARESFSVILRKW